MNSATVSPGDLTIASQYNNLRKDTAGYAGLAATATGSGGNYVVSIDAQIVALFDGLKIVFRANHTNAGATTININAIGAVGLVNSFGDAHAGGEIINGDIYLGVYNSTSGDVHIIGSGISTVGSTAGQVLTSNGSGVLPTFQTIGGAPTVVTSNTSMAVNTAYHANASATRIDMLLPTTAAVGDWVIIRGKGLGGYRVTQNSSEVIYQAHKASTSGASGFWLPNGVYDSVKLTCITADTEWAVEFTTGGNVDTQLGVWDKGHMGYTTSTANVGSVSDDANASAFSEVTSGGTIYLYLGSFTSGVANRPISCKSNNYQEVTATTAFANTRTPMRPVIKNGLLFISASNAECRYINYKTTDISAGAWTAATLSGFPGNSIICGFAGGYYWFKSTGTANDFYRATFSGGTFTYVDTISVTTGSTTTPEFNAVNEKGVFVFTNGSGASGQPQTKFSNHAGTNDTTLQMARQIFAATTYSGYSLNLQAGSVYHVIKVF